MKKQLQTKIGILLILTIVLWSFSGCTQDPLTGFTIANSEQDTSSAKEESTKEISPEKDTPSAKEETLQEDSIDEGAAREAETQKAVAEIQKSQLEETKETLEQQLEETEEKINELGKSIAEKEKEAIEKRYGKKSSKSKKKKANALKKQLEEIKEKEVKETEERAKEIILQIQKEQEVKEQLKELGEKVSLKPTVIIDSKVAAKTLEQAIQLIESKEDTQKALDDLKNIYEHSSDISLQVEAGSNIIKGKLLELEKTATTPSNKANELRKQADEIVKKAESLGSDVQVQALEAKGDVAKKLRLSKELIHSTEKILKLDPTNIMAYTDSITASHSLEKEPTKILQEITKLKEIAKLKDQEPPLEIDLTETASLVKTGSVIDLNKAKESSAKAIKKLKNSSLNTQDIIETIEPLLRSETTSKIKVKENQGKLQVLDPITGMTITDEDLLSNIINKMGIPEKLAIYAVNQQEYINTATYNTNNHIIDGAIYYISKGDVYRYNAFGSDKKLGENESSTIKNKIFSTLVKNGMEIPLKDELLPESQTIKRTPIQKIGDTINTFIFNQANPGEI